MYREDHVRKNEAIALCGLAEPRRVLCQVRVDGTVGNVWNGRLSGGTLELGPNDGCVIEVKDIH